MVRPVLVIQHLSSDGPAYLGTWLARQRIACDVRDAEAGAALPADLSGHSAIAVLGGEMSANDPLPHLRQTESLLRQAFDRAVPALGHCLGGQLMARALGAAVVASPAPEVGWQPITVCDTALARGWFGAGGEHTVFQWHYEAFDLPPSVERVAGSAACPNQAFAVGPHLAMQFHVELDAAKLASWTGDASERYLQALRQSPGTVQHGTAMLAAAADALAVQQRLADRIYRRWLSGIALDVS